MDVTKDSFKDILNAICEAGMVTAVNNKLFFPVKEEALKLPAYGITTDAKSIHVMGMCGIIGRPNESQDNYPISGIDMNKIRRCKGCGQKTTKYIAMSELEYLYYRLDKKEKELFWCDFISYNSPTLIAKAL